MRDRKPVKPATQTMSASEIRQNFSEVVNRVYRGEERVLIEAAAYRSPPSSPPGI